MAVPEDGGGIVNIPEKQKQTGVSACQRGLPLDLTLWYA
jgi:hypothetical protein